MTTFDDILPKLGSLFHQYATELPPLCPIAINRDLNGRVRLIAPEQHREHPVWDKLATAISEALRPHAPAPHRLFLWEDDVQAVCEQGHAFSLWTALDEDVPCQDGVALQVQVIDRLVTESNWADITSPSATSKLTHLGVALVLLFVLTGEQTWSGYRMLFRHWRTRGVAQRIRDRLQLVAAMLPETNTAQHLAHLRERAWDVFGSELYDQLEGAEEGFNFDVGDEFAPHSPVPIRWNRGFEAIPHLHDRLHTLLTT